jgi:TRAP-type mannitol/chloroaromatic compound transport system permease large subunit
MQKYPFLRFATIVLRVVGWIVLVVGVIGSILFGIRTAGVTGVSYAVGGAIFSFLTWLFLLATRELIYLFVNVEENTRITAENTRITAESITKKSR